MQKDYELFRGGGVKGDPILMLFGHVWQTSHWPRRGCCQCGTPWKCPSGLVAPGDHGWATRDRSLCPALPRPPSSWINLTQGRLGHGCCNRIDHHTLEITCNKHSRIFLILKRKCKSNCHSLPSFPNVTAWPQPTSVRTPLCIYPESHTGPDSLTEVQESRDKLLANFHISGIWVNLLDHKMVSQPPL